MHLDSANFRKHLKMSQFMTETTIFNVHTAIYKKTYSRSYSELKIFRFVAPLKATSTCVGCKAYISRKLMMRKRMM